LPRYFVDLLLEFLCARRRGGPFEASLWRGKGQLPFADKSLAG
jgi:hypothetical protein